MDIKDINKKIIGSEITISGWIKNHRKQAKFGFIDLNDGTCFNSLQVVYNDELDLYLLCVTHFGTMWSGVPSNWKSLEELEAEE